ncbi:hypothetical protein [Marinilabilia sp.]|uniref:hypothetical protein n=1 Tax=Marinilabilia sp. TaxID=2021252 RepID=UPI0025B87DCD|nr:hypothetical protein [Marinilabilia sp.]
MIEGIAFSLAHDLYTEEFNQVAKLLIYSYQQMVENNEVLTSDHETYLRNILVKKYLRNKDAKQKYDIGYLGFEIESGEIDINNQTVGFIDIKVLNLGNKDLLDEDEYYSIECKRLDGESTKNNLYIKEGINRYVNSKYSQQMPFSAMVGFIESGITANIKDNINSSLIENKYFQTYSSLLEYVFVADFKETFVSKHERKNSQFTDIEIFHFLFDFQGLIKKEYPQHST